MAHPIFYLYWSEGGPQKLIDKSLRVSHDTTFIFMSF